MLQDQQKAMMTMMMLITSIVTSLAYTLFHSRLSSYYSSCKMQKTLHHKTLD